MKLLSPLDGEAGGSAVSGLPVFIGERGPIGFGDTPIQTIPNAQFVTIGLDVVVDNFNAFNPTSSHYVIPQDGTYEISGKYRLFDGTNAGRPIGIGMHTSNDDHSAFFWDNTKNNRQGIQNVRLMSCLQGQSIRLFAYLDATSTGNLVSAVMTIQRIR